MYVYFTLPFLLTFNWCSSTTYLDEGRSLKRVVRRQAYTDKVELCKLPSQPDIQKYTLYDKTEIKIDLTPGITRSNIIVRCAPGLLTRNETQFFETFCQHNTWVPPIDGCDIPDCGLSQDPLILSTGEIAWFTEVPWHVAIYKVSANYALTCGGTLISPLVVMSAAICFYDTIKHAPINKTNDYQIVVAKKTRDFLKRDNLKQKTYKVKKFIHPEKGYNPYLSGHEGSDIIMIILEEPVAFSQYVYPACIDWSNYRGFNPGKNVTGKVAGWGTDESGRYSQNLKTAELTYVSYNECVTKLNLVPIDKFCAGTDEGAGVTKGDGGGGLLFRNPANGLFYLRGIVSTRVLYKNVSTTTFTDVSQYIQWIDKERKIIKDLY